MAQYSKIARIIIQKGRKAYQDGKRLEQCPYTCLSWMSRKYFDWWREGYFDAQANENDDDEISKANTCSIF